MTLVCDACGEVESLCDCLPEERRLIAPYDRKVGCAADRAVPLVAALELLEQEEAHSHLAYDALCRLPPAAWPALAQMASALGLLRCRPIEAYNALADTYQLRRTAIERRARHLGIDLEKERARLQRIDKVVADFDAEMAVREIEEQGGKDE